MRHLETDREWKLREQAQSPQQSLLSVRTWALILMKSVIGMEAFLAPGPLGAGAGAGAWAGAVTDCSCSNDPISVMRSVSCPTFCSLRGILPPTP